MGDTVKTEHKSSSGTRGNGTPAWYLGNSRYSVRNGNKFTPYFCGKDIFAALAGSIRGANKSVDVVCWGFDPAMQIVRASEIWTPINAYGEILKNAAARGVKVRVLIWYNVLVNTREKNVVGKMMTASVATVNRKDPAATAYPETWFKEVEAGKYPNLEVRFRDIKNQKGGLPEEDRRSLPESGVLSFPSDHQKSVMIDYGHGKCHGYIMGHNSLTAYWDTEQMLHSTKLREFNGKPFHDFSMQIQGPCLIDLNHNFCESWDDNPPTYKNLERGPGGLGTARPSHLLQERSALDKNITSPGSASGQIVRTRPDKRLKNGQREKEIKRAYMLVAQNPRRFILIVNQYFQYPRWARQLRAHLEAAKKAGYPKELFVFIVTPTPENAGMILNTHKMANEFGVSDQMGTAEKEIYHQKTGHIPAGKGSILVKAGEQTAKGRAWGAEPKRLKADLAKIGINAVFCMLKTKVNAVPREIYIHAKLTVIDDAFFTLGSANLNIRSMAVDSEINIISTDIPTAYSWRKKLFDLYTSGAVAQHGQSQGAKKFFKDFSTHVLKNEERVGKKTAIIGHAVPFAEPRTASAANVG